jgi:hypothetical protein
MPNLGIIASSISASLNASSYESIATGTGTGSSATISFASIPSTYTHLQIRGILRNTTAAYAGIQNLTIRFNSDSGANYTYHYVGAIQDNAPAVAAGASTSATGINVNAVNISDGGLANDYGAIVLDILDYKNTNKYKTARLLCGVDQNGTTTANTGLAFGSGLWMNSAAITQIDVITGSANWKTGTTFALYGIKG